jgi:hypothetical protein
MASNDSLQFLYVVSYDKGEASAREFKMTFFETSAMTDVNVEEAFILRL